MNPMKKLWLERCEFNPITVNPSTNEGKMKERNLDKLIPPGSSVATEHDILDDLTFAVERMGSQTAVAKDLGIGESFLGDILHGRRKVCKYLAGKLGWRKVTVFLKP